ncbi:MAG: AMP-binding protein [Clostridia bacterium]|nr:AMP-binding protein [Clostridia bacterium]
MKKTERKFTPINTLKDQVRVYESHGDKIAFDYFGKTGNVRTMTYTKYANKIRAFCAGLKEIGKAGARVAIIGETSPKWHIAYHATICGGGVAIPLDKELAIEEIENFLMRSGAKVFVFSNLFEKKFIDMAKAHPEIVFIPMTKCETEGVYDKNMNDIIALGEGKPDAFAEDADVHKMSVMLFTSGTTGTSKCVMLSEANVCAAVNAACDSVYFFPNDVLLSVLPVHHTYELCCTIAGMNYGMEVAINDSLRHVLRNINKFKPTALVLVPLFVNTMEKRIWDELRKKNLDGVMKKLMSASNAMRKVGIDARRILFSAVLKSFGGRLKKIVCGGAPLNQDIANTFRSLGIEIWEGYGITECSPLVAVDVYYAPKPGSVGTAVPCCDVRIDGNMADKDGHIIGEICVKGDNVMLGYYEDPEATDAVFTEDGYFRTGDVGYMDEDGYLYITGRQKSVIVLENGKNVFPEEIEEYLEPIDMISECVVVGRQAEGSDNIILTAVIYPDMTKFPEGATKDDVRAAVKTEIDKINRSLVSYKHIRDIDIRDTEFIKTTTRKIRRNLVK